jgi:hypothetical protein
MRLHQNHICEEEDNDKVDLIDIAFIYKNFSDEDPIVD